MYSAPDIPFLGDPDQKLRWWTVHYIVDVFHMWNDVCDVVGVSDLGEHVLLPDESCFRCVFFIFI